jgi:hypothetical protein
MNEIISYLEAVVVKIGLSDSTMNEDICMEECSKTT